MFSNELCGGAKRRTRRVPKQRKVQKGGTSVANSVVSALSPKGFNAASSVFQSHPAPVTASMVIPRNAAAKPSNVGNAKPSNAKVITNAKVVFPKAVGNVVKTPFVNYPQAQRVQPLTAPKISGGNNLKTMTQLMEGNSSLYQLRNKRGGGVNVPQSDLALSYSIPRFTHTNGYDVNRSLASSEVVNRMLASESTSAPLPFSKDMHYGAPYDAKVGFTYSPPNTVTKPVVQTPSTPSPPVQAAGGRLAKLVKKAKKAVKRSKPKAHK